MAIVAPTSSQSSVWVFDLNPTAVVTAAPGAGAYVAVTLTGEAASATIVQYSFDVTTNSVDISLDGTNAWTRISTLDDDFVFIAKPPIYIKGTGGSSAADIKVLGYQLGGQVKTT